MARALPCIGSTVGEIPDLLAIDEDLAALPGLAGARPVAAALGRLDRG